MRAMLRSKMVRSMNKKGVGTASSKRLRPTHRSASRTVIAIASCPLPLATSLFGDPLFAACYFIAQCEAVTKVRSQLASPEGTLIDRRLNDGGRLIAVVRPDVAYAVAGFWLKVGSASDEPSKEGTAHLWEHLAPLHPHGDATAQIAIEQLGGLLSPETGRDFMAFPIATADAAALPTMLSLLRGALLTPPNSAALLEREKALMRLEMRALWDDPLWVGKTLLEARWFANTPFANPRTGWLPRLDELTLEDVRAFTPPIASLKTWRSSPSSLMNGCCRDWN